MKIRQKNSFFILKSSSGIVVESEGPLYQATHYHPLILALLAAGNSTIEGIQTLSRQLQTLARHAQLARQYNVMEQASEILLALPISDQQKHVAWYYQAICNLLQGNLDQARHTLEQVAEGATPQYRARALLTLGTTCYNRGEFDAALPCYVQAGRASVDCDLMTFSQSQIMVAVIRSAHGDHKQALADLENLFPLVRTVGRYYPATYYDYLNSLAVELGEVGRIEEAQAALAIALASPFAPAYPNWHETRAELEEKRASGAQPAVAVREIPEPAATPIENADPEPDPVRSIYVRVIIGFITTTSRVALVVVATIAPAPISQTILDRLGRYFRPRGPPTHFRYNCL